MLSTFEPSSYLSKRENGTYCVIHNGMPLNPYTTKEQCNKVAERYGVKLPSVVWSAKHLSFIEE